MEHIKHETQTTVFGVLKRNREFVESLNSTTVVYQLSFRPQNTT